MAKRPIFYDTETTGIKTDKDRVIEIAAYDPLLNKTFEELIHPGIPIPPEATAVHKITDQMVADKPPFGEIAARFIEFCAGDVVLIAHNNDNFDMPILRAEFARAQIEMPPWTFLDSLKWARRYRPDLPRHPLQFLREIYGIPANNAHRALDDVLVLHQIFSFLTDDLTIEQVLELLTGPKKITRMPFGKYQGKLFSEIPKDYIVWLAGSGAFDKPENASLRAALENEGLLSGPAT